MFGSEKQMTDKAAQDAADQAARDAAPKGPGQAEYENWLKSQSGYVGKTNKAGWWDSYNKTQQSKGMMDGYLNDPQNSFTVAGDGEQQMNIAANLSQVGAMTGQNIFQTGQQQQDYLQSLQSRRNGDDAVAANMMAGRNRNLANVGRQFAGRGVAGGVAAAGMNTASNTADSEINSQMQKNARTNDQDLWNYVKRNQKVTGEALSAGSDQGLAAGMDTSTAEGAFGTVICTELHRQGYMDEITYRKDALFGAFLEVSNPHAMRGYRILAAPVVRKMKTSKRFTSFVAFFAMPWARYMMGEKSLLGSIIMHTGIPMCSLFYKVFYHCDECDFDQPHEVRNV